MKRKCSVRLLNEDDLPSLNRWERDRFNRGLSFAVVDHDGSIVKQCMTPAMAERWADQYEEEAL